MLGTVLRAWYTSNHLNLTTTLEDGHYCYSILQIKKLKHKEMKCLPKVTELVNGKAWIWICPKFWNDIAFVSELGYTEGGFPLFRRWMGAGGGGWEWGGGCWPGLCLISRDTPPWDTPLNPRTLPWEGFHYNLPEDLTSWHNWITRGYKKTWA